jgi:hypothetical protein
MLPPDQTWISFGTCIDGDLYTLRCLGYAWLKRIRTTLCFDGCRSAAQGSATLIGETCIGSLRGGGCFRMRLGRCEIAWRRRGLDGDVIVNFRWPDGAVIEKNVDLSHTGCLHARSPVCSTVHKPLQTKDDGSVYFQIGNYECTYCLTHSSIGLLNTRLLLVLTRSGEKNATKACTARSSILTLLSPVLPVLKIQTIPVDNQR